MMNEDTLLNARRITNLILSGDVGQAEMKMILRMVEGACWSEETYKVLANAACLVQEICHRDMMAYSVQHRKPWEFLLGYAKGVV